jgi:ferredoxin
MSRTASDIVPSVALTTDRRHLYNSSRLEEPFSRDIVSMPKITILNEQKKEIEVPAGANLRQALREAGVEVYSGIDKYLNCRGLGLCGTCAVLVKKGMEGLGKKTLRERFNFTLHPKTSFMVIGHEDEMRLSCQCKVEGDCEIEVRPSFNLSGEVFWSKPYPNK